MDYPAVAAGARVKILLGGYYGAGNLGDELLRRLITGWLRRAGHTVEIIGLDPSPADADVVDHRRLPELARRLAGSDLLVLGGGGLFQDHHRFRIADLFRYPAPGISYYAQLCLLARRLGRPYLLFAMGVGPLRRGEARAITREVFQHAAHLSVRDSASAALLAELGVTRPARVGADPAWLMPKVPGARLDSVFPCLAGRRVAVIVPRHWPFRQGWRGALADGLKALEAAGYAFLWLPFQPAGTDGDRAVCRELAASLAPATPQAHAETDDPFTAAAWIASADVLVAMRLHATIIGLRHAVPMAVLEYDDKLTALADMLALPGEVRLRLDDPAPRFRQCLDVLARRGDTGGRAPIDAWDPIRGARQLRDRLLLDLEGIRPGNASGPPDWRDPAHDWLLDWTLAGLDDAAAELRRLREDHAALASRLAGIERSLPWKALAPVRLLGKMHDIARAQGIPALGQKLGRAALARLAQPLANRCARLHLRRILGRHAGKPLMVFPPLVPWNLTLFQRPHHLARELAARGHLYFFCIPVTLEECVPTFREVAPGCFVTPHFDLLEDLPGKWLHLYSTDNWRGPGWVRERMARGDRVLYEYVDEIHEDISGHPIPGDSLDRHHELLQNEEVICIATSDPLYREVRRYRSRHCALVTNGVDTAHFAVRRGSRPPPPPLRPLVASGRPVIGYFGALAKWFDYALVAELASRRPGYEFVLIGPDYDGSVAWLARQALPNIRLAGAIDYTRLPEHACWFDVATIPFRLNEITASTSPIKLFEYMALGLPVVTTDLPECRKYRSVLIAADAARFVERIDLALSLRGDADYLRLLREEAMANDWSHKAGQLMRAMSPAPAAPLVREP